MEGRRSVAYNNLREIKERLKARVRVRVWAALHPKTKRGTATASAASIATTFAATRVFKGNIVLARLSQSVATKAARKSLCTSSEGHGIAIGDQIGARSAGQSVRRLQTSVAGLPGSKAANQSLPVQDTSAGSGESQVMRNGAVAPNQVHAAVVGKTPQEAEGAGMGGREVVEQSSFLTAAQAVMLPLVANMCYVFMHGLNRTEVYGAEKLVDAIQNRPKGQALVTVCNHVAAMDDPLVLSAMVPPSMLLHATSMRWTLCATDRCFKNAPMAAFFRSVKVLPVKRGEGVDQKGMDVAVSKVQRGDWVHIFPEGRRSRDGGRTLGSIKRGIGRLLSGSEQAPLLVPFIHSGMHKLLAVGSKMPTVGNKVTVLVGDPIEIQDLLDEHRQLSSRPAELYDAIAARVSEKMVALKQELDAKLKLREGLRDDQSIMLGQVTNGGAHLGAGIGPAGERQGVNLREDVQNEGSGQDEERIGGRFRVRSSGLEHNAEAEDWRWTGGGISGERRPIDSELVDSEGEPLGFWGWPEEATWKLQEHRQQRISLGFAVGGLLGSELDQRLGFWGNRELKTHQLPSSRGQMSVRWWGQAREDFAAFQRGGFCNDRSANFA